MRRRHAGCHLPVEMSARAGFHDGAHGDGVDWACPLHGYLYPGEVELEPGFVDPGGALEGVARSAELLRSYAAGTAQTADNLLRLNPDGIQQIRDRMRGWWEKLDQAFAAAQAVAPADGHGPYTGPPVDFDNPPPGV